MAEVTVLGAGSWGTALALMLAQNGHSVKLWARSPALAHSLQEAHENFRYLPGFALPELIQTTSDMGLSLTNASSVVFAVPCGALREVAVQALPFIENGTLLISAAKGLEAETGLRMSQVLAEELPEAPARTVALSGPNLALEMARGVPTACVAASVNPEASSAVQKLFSSQSPPTFRVYTGRDLIGVELGGAVKNVIAIGAGVCDALGYGDNARAALMTRGLTEAIRLGIAQGAEPLTFAGLSGVGDLIATGNSRLSRNYRLGFGLGQGKPLQQVLAELGQVAEGAPTTRVLCALAQRSGIEMPLCHALYTLLFEGLPAPEVIRGLMMRPLRPEAES